MNFQSAGAVYQKELLELVRDRRALISMVAMPLIFFPLLFAGIAKFSISRMKEADEEKVVVAILGKDKAPELMSAIASSGFQTVVKTGLRDAVERKEVSTAVEETVSPTGLKSVQVYVDKTRPESQIAGGKIRAALDKWKEQTVRQSLQGAGVAETLLTPFSVEEVNVAPQKKMAGFVLGSMLGYMIVLMLFTGAMYPAIDMTAGEKERRTLEAILSSPASRDGIVLGKVAAAATAALITGTLTVASMMYSFKYGPMSQMMGNPMSTDVLDARTLGLVVLNIIPTAILAASLIVAIALFAKSYKEGQTYVSPVLMLVIFPAILGMLPGLELTPVLALIPIFNVCQLVKEIFLGSFSPISFVVAFTANLVYASAAFFVATRIFKNESVLFRV